MSLEVFLTVSYTNNMKIRQKIFLVVLPLIIVPLLITVTTTFLSASTGITRLAHQLLDFKLRELKKYADNQWSLLVENNYAGRPDMVQAAQKAVERYGQSIIISDTGFIRILTIVFITFSSPCGTARMNGVVRS